MMIMMMNMCGKENTSSQTYFIELTVGLGGHEKFSDSTSLSAASIALKHPPQIAVEPLLVSTQWELITSQSGSFRFQIMVGLESSFLF